jgi:hypothetical protein
MADRAVRLRLVIVLVLAGYLAVIVTSHFILMPLFLEGPLALVGWLFLAGLIVWSRLRRVDTRPSSLPPLRDMLRPWALTVAFGVIAAVVLYLATAWDVPARCHVTLNCVKGYEWRTENGKYYHVIEGVSTEISQKAYAQEVDLDLRSAAAFGVYTLCLAWVGTTVLRYRREVPTPVHGDLR